MKRSVFLLPLLLLACSGSTATAPGGGATPDKDAASSSDGSTTTGLDGGTGASTGDGGVDGGVTDEIWPKSATMVLADSPGGGFVPTPPAGSECKSGQQRFSVVIATKLFTFERCQMGATFSDPYKLLTGSRTISPSEYDTIDQAMAQLTKPKSTGCGADKAELKVTVTTPTGDRTYYDSFYQCMDPKRVYVDNIDGVFTAFNALVKTK